MSSLTDPAILKTCTRCKETKPLAAFGRHAGRKTGINERCRQCNALANPRHPAGKPYAPHPHYGLPHPARFWAKVEKTATCWLWVASKNQYGYGSYRLNGRGYLAHRMAYELLRGPIPDGYDLDHLCRIHACVNPDHLEVVTRRENTARGVNHLLRRTATHCKRGHAFDATNTRLTKGGHRQCRACARERGRINWHKYAARARSCAGIE